MPQRAKRLSMAGNMVEYLSPVKHFARLSRSRLPNLPVDLARARAVKADLTNSPHS